jgi:hypothetical protein
MPISRFLGAFANLRKATINLCHVCLPFRMEQLGFHWMDFHEILYLSIFRKPVEKIQVLLKSNKNSGILHENLCTFTMVCR